MQAFREIASALWLGLSSGIIRPRNLLLIVAGFLISGLTLLVLLAIPAGLQRLAGHTGRDDVAIVLAASAQNESTSTLVPEDVQLVSALPGIAHDSQGHPTIAPQFVANTKLQRTDGSMVDLLMRGVTPAFWDIVGDSIRITQGKKPRPGIAAIIAGTGVATAHNDIHVGTSIPLRGSMWQITGEFDAHGSVWDSELWTDLQALQAAFNAQGHVSSIWVRLARPAAYARFAAALRLDQRLRDTRTMRQRDYYSEQIGFIARFIRIAAVGIACVLGLGAMLAIANALGLALEARRNEIAMLRAVGFGRTTVAVALLAEVSLIGFICACVAVAIGWFLLRGYSIDSSTGAYAIRFHMTVTGAVALWTLVYLLILGLLSAIWPVMRTVRAPLLSALRVD